MVRGIWCREVQRLENMAHRLGTIQKGTSMKILWCQDRKYTHENNKLDRQVDSKVEKTQKFIDE